MIVSDLLGSVYVDRPSPTLRVEGLPEDDALGLCSLSEGQEFTVDERRCVHGEVLPAWYIRTVHEFGAGLMHWLTLGRFRHCAMRIIPERRLLLGQQVALCVTIKLWVTAHNGNDQDLTYLHWAIDQDLMAMDIMRGSPWENASATARAVANTASDRLYKRLRDEGLGHLLNPWEAA